jgi:predicted esterase
MKKKKLQFLYGLGNRNEYKSLFKYFDVLKIDWNNSKIKIKKCDTLIGFSLGCMLAIMYAEKHKLKHLVLCSPSPEETLKNVKADKITFIAGEKEEWVIKNTYRIAKGLKCSWTLIKVPNTGHKINKDYQKVIIENL